MQVLVTKKENNIMDNNDDELKKIIKSGDVKQGNLK